MLKIIFKVAGKVFDFDLMEEEMHDQLLNEWQRSPVECICRGKKYSTNPLLYVKRVKDNFYLANYPSNRKNDVLHDFKCRYNRFGYRSLLDSQGIKIDKNRITCSLDFSSRRNPNRQSSGPLASTSSTASAKLNGPERGGRETTQSKAKLTTLFLTMLTELQHKVSEYNPKMSRNIAKRLYRIAEKITIDKLRLYDILFVASIPDKHPIKDKHQCIIGWGYRSTSIPHPTNKNLIRLPLYSVDDPKLKVTDITMFKGIYERCTSIDANVNSGFYVLFRGPTHARDKNVMDRELCFIPAEENTKIPVESSYECQMLTYLYEKGRHFEKPLIGNVTELFLEQRPDIVLHDTEPKTIIEIAGLQDENYVERLLKKKNIYLEKGFRYYQWNGEDPISI